ncbi:hypothetical protein G7054_g1964 [Neopestalotiopsis clavispora]|nr:hypothetical protein G7054_g1964 [Neopestalotiopsis clavispora]
MSDPDKYTVGWITAITREFIAAKAFLDEEHEGPRNISRHDNNNYTLGRIGKHNVVIAILPDGDYGTASAASTARDLLHSFPNIRIGLMVGIGGGAPTMKNDIRLGDIVVSMPQNGYGGVFQFDFGKTIQYQEFQATRLLDQPPIVLRAAVNKLKAEYAVRGHCIQEDVQAALNSWPRLRRGYNQPDPATDRLYRADIVHPPGSEAPCYISCGNDADLLVSRCERDISDFPTIHYGLIASANQLMKDADIRDKLAHEKNVLCFEMEAAGLMNHYPCLVIRGICDYSDTHKNKQWQGYAAMTAAAYAKDILNNIRPSKIEAERKSAEVLSDEGSQLGSIDSQLQTTRPGIESIRKDTHPNEILQWLAPPNVSSNLNKAIKTRHVGSGYQFLNCKAYTTWKSGESSFLWLHGIPGCGKTILVSTIIEDLRKDQNQNPSHTLLYFYFDSTESQKQSFENTLRSLTWQIYNQNENGQQCLKSLYSSTCRDGQEQPSFDSLHQTLINMICKLKEVWIVLDALDECKPRGELLSWLCSIAQSSLAQVTIHLLVTSRPEQDIKTAIKRHASDEHMIAIRHDLLESDIQNYIRARVREHEGLSRWRRYPEIQDKIESTLLAKASGMRILQILAYSTRPLRLDEAVDAIAVDIGKNVARGHRFDPENRLPTPEEITRYCGGLIILVSRQGGHNEEQEVTEVQLAHVSVKDYLLSAPLENMHARYFHEIPARSCIAIVCLAYLSELGCWTTVEEVKKKFPFAQYSAQYWASHAVIAERNSEYAFKLAKDLFLSKSLFESWLRLFNSEFFTPSYRNLHDTPTALYCATLLGLPRCVEVILQDGADTGIRSADYGIALQAASYNGHTDIVQTLVCSNANVDYQIGYYSTALCIAATKGYKDIVQILIENGADVNIWSGIHGTALQAAMAKGYQDIVQILVDHGAEALPQGKNRDKVLQSSESNKATPVYSAFNCCLARKKS